MIEVIEVRGDREGEHAKERSQGEAKEDIT